MDLGHSQVVADSLDKVEQYISGIWADLRSQAELEPPRVNVVKTWNHSSKAEMVWTRDDQFVKLLLAKDGIFLEFGNPSAKRVDGRHIFTCCVNLCMRVLYHWYSIPRWNKNATILHSWNLGFALLPFALEPTHHLRQQTLVLWIAEWMTLRECKEWYQQKAFQH